MLDANRSAQNFARVHRIADSQELASIVAEMERLTFGIATLKEHMEKAMQKHVAELSLAESRKAIEMTDSVKLLTQLAFLFVPLTFSASIFGVNAAELGSGSRPFSLFLITAFVFLGFTLSGLWLYRKLSDKFRRQLLRFAVLFVRWSPLVSMILTAWLLFDSQPRTYDDTLLSDTSYSLFLNWIREDFGARSVPHRGRFRASILTTSKFWQRRLVVSEQFLNEPGWKTNLVTARWRRKSRAALGILKNGLKAPGWLIVGWAMAVFVRLDSLRARIGRATGS
ncbi:hypothetical protein E8E14_008561 [Neopestalotiopsis sp. 37M]|nr:hypothetical protein E8E14_008561 [Neopestalotiopsis sp. 37M]